MASMLRAGLAGPCSLRVGVLAQEGPRVHPQPAPFLSLNSSVTVSLWTGGFCCKKYKTRDKIKVIFIWEVESELPTGNWALGHFYCSWGSAGDLCGCKPRHYAIPYSKVSALHSMLLKPSLLPPTQPGQEG